MEGIDLNQISALSDINLLITQKSKYECRDKESPSKKDKKNNGKKKLSDDENEEKAEESGGEDTQLDNIE